MNTTPPSPERTEPEIPDGENVRNVLQASETRYRHLFETTEDGILILDADTGQIVEVNTFLVDLLGSLHERFLGKKYGRSGISGTSLPAGTILRN